MTATQGNLASLSRYIFTAPRWYATLTFALVVAALSGVAAFDSAFVLDDAWQGVFFVGLPTVAASLLTASFDRALGGQLTHNRASLLALACELLVIAMLTGAAVIAVLTPLGQPFVFNTLLVALAAIFAFRLLIVMAISRHRLLVAAVPASVQTVAAALLLFVYSGTLRYVQVGGPLFERLFSRPNEAALSVTLPPVDFLLLTILCLLYAGAVWLFLFVIDQPWQRSLGVSVLDFLQGFISHIAEGGRELEDFFEGIGEDAVVPVTVFSARRSDGTEKARFVLPMIHPGPMGEIGGGNLPQRVADSAEGLAFAPHATAGHDFNLVTEREVETIIDAADRAHGTIDYDETATPGRRVSVGEATLTGHLAGEGLLSTLTFSPGCADDVAYAVGLSARAHARCEDVEEVLLADAHNCNDGLSGPDLGHVVPGDRRSFDVLDGTERLRDRLLEVDRGPLSLGVAHDETPWEPREGIGPLGVRVAVFDVAGHTTAYVLVDGNNMEPGLRDRIVATLEDGVVDLAEVLTSDTHIVNTVEAENQVGQAVPAEDLLALIEDCTDRALADREPVSAGMATEQAEVTVFGNDRTETMASTANAVVSLGAPLAGAFVAVMLAVSVLLFFLT
ncbi:DUF2070 family protein [Halapricum sp. CBA1109]|uniref:DUF2070 family protein n=1 Tax=Halapricum sp. CBA1109 TaxID=2668068 RepID=UPI0012FA51A7|nr:DUF2070 family protein [Halapricum sp. CBA1109]MUV89548.1 DUF2070 family protein [Halapricum sp. CBA1109]